MTEFRIKTVRRAACAAGIAAVVATSGIGIGNAFAQPVQSSTDDATAEFIDRDGATTSVQPDSVRYCSIAGFSIPLSSGQELPFEKVKSIDVLGSDDKSVQNGTASIDVTLVNGTAFRDSMPSNCDLFGRNDIGRFSIFPQDLQRLEFTRAVITAPAPTPRAVPPQQLPNPVPVPVPAPQSPPGDNYPGDKHPGPGDKHPGPVDKHPGPVDKHPGDKNPGGQNPGDKNPGGQNPGDKNPGGQNPGDKNPGGQNPGDKNPGGQNPGDQNNTQNNTQS